MPRYRITAEDFVAEFDAADKDAALLQRSAKQAPLGAELRDEAGALVATKRSELVRVSCWVPASSRNEGAGSSARVTVPDGPKDTESKPPKSAA
jgi:hypothetical protein